MIRFRRPMRVRFRLLRDDLSELSIPIGLIVCCVIAFLVTGCVASPSADVLKALANDTNSLCVTVTSPWGGMTIDRNHCSGPPAPTAKVIVPNVQLNPNGTVRSFGFSQ